MRSEFVSSVYKECKGERRLRESELDLVYLPSVLMTRERAQLLYYGGVGGHGQSVGCAFIKVGGNVWAPDSMWCTVSYWGVTRTLCEGERGRESARASVKKGKVGGEREICSTLKDE